MIWMVGMIGVPYEINMFVSVLHVFAWFWSVGLCYLCVGSITTPPRISVRIQDKI